MLFAAVAALLGALGWALGGWGPAGAGALAGILLGVGFLVTGDRVLLGLTGAEPSSAAALPPVATAAAALAQRLAIPPPRLALIQDSHPRLFVVGRGPGSSTLVVTRGLLTLDPATREALIAHELAHVRNRDVLVQTVLAVQAALLLELSRIGGFLQRVLLFLLAPLAASAVHLVLSPRREFAADAVAASLTSGPAVAAALATLNRAMQYVDVAASPASSILYPLDPFPDDPLGRMFASHPPLPQRLERLQRLDPPWDDDEQPPLEEAGS